MKKIIDIFKYQHIVFICLLAMSVLAMSACKEDEEIGPKTGEGQVVFQVVKKNLYSINSLSEMVSLKPVLLYGEETIELPSLSLEGNDNIIQSEPYILKAGVYKVISYKAADKDGNWIADLTLDDNNTFEVLEGKEPVYFDLPTGIRVNLSTSFLKNVLLGICNEIWPDDKDKWIWKGDDEWEDWTNLEWEIDEETGSFLAITGLIFDRKFYEMETLPEPACNLSAVESMVFIGDSVDNGVTLKNKLKYLPKKLIQTNVKVLTIINCEIDEFPEFLTECDLHALSFVDCNISSIPESIANMENLRVLSLKGNKLTSIPASIGKMKSLVSLDISNNPIESLPEGVFDGCTALQHIVLSNTGLSDLPALPAISEPAFGLSEIIGRGLYMEGCKFTSIPASALACPAVRTLYIKDNQITSVALGASDMKNIDQLYLDGNQLTSLSIESDKLIALGLSNCGLTAVPANVNAGALLVMDLSDNKIASVPDNYFSGYPHISQIKLKGNVGMTSLPADLGLTMDNNSPKNLLLLDLEDMPALNWSVPAEWRNVVLHKTGGAVEGNEHEMEDQKWHDGAKPLHYINIYAAGSPNVRK